MMDLQTVILNVGSLLIAIIALIALKQKRRYARLLKEMQAQLQSSTAEKATLKEAEIEAEQEEILAQIAMEPAITAPAVTPLMNSEKASPKKKSAASKIEPSFQNPAVEEKPVLTTVEPIIETAATEKAAKQIAEPSQPTASANIAPKAKPAFNVTPRDFIVLTLLAKPNQPYTGYELLQALLAAGLRFGKMNVFHRYEQASGQGEILFSLASAVEPGVFEINKMGNFSCPGLTMFLQLGNFQESNKDLLNAFDLMLETAQQLVEDLGGEVCDEQRQPLRREKINDWRAYLEYFERSRQIPDLFEH